MKRRWFAVLGATILAAEAGVLLSASGPSLGSVGGFLLGIAGVLFLLGGFDPVPGTVPWDRFLGAGVLALGALFVVGWVPPALEPDATWGDLALAVAGAANGLVLGVVGADWLLGGQHFGLSSLEPEPLLGDRDGAPGRGRDDEPGG